MWQSEIYGFKKRRNTTDGMGTSLEAWHVSYCRFSLYFHLFVYTSYQETCTIDTGIYLLFRYRRQLECLGFSSNLTVSMRYSSSQIFNRSANLKFTLSADGLTDTFLEEIILVETSLNTSVHNKTASRIPNTVVVKVLARDTASIDC